MQGNESVRELLDALIEEGRKIGREEVRQKDIRKLVKRFHKLGLSDEAILESIMEIFDLSEENAREYLEESN